MFKFRISWFKMFKDVLYPNDQTENYFKIIKKLMFRTIAHYEEIHGDYKLQTKNSIELYLTSSICPVFFVYSELIFNKFSVKLHINSYFKHILHLISDK